MVIEAKVDKRMVCPKCHRRVNKFRAVKKETFEWYGDRENGEYVSGVALYNEVHHCGGILHSEIIQ